MNLSPHKPGSANSLASHFVRREKESIVFSVLKRRTRKDPRILADETVRMCRKGSAGKYPVPLGRITALVEVDGHDGEPTFITNRFAWSPRPIAELFRAR